MRKLIKLIFISLVFVFIYNSGFSQNFSLEFDGIDDYVIGTHSGELNFTNTFSFSCWVYLTSITGSRQFIFTNAQSNGANAQYIFGISDIGKIYFYGSSLPNPQGVYLGETTLNLNVWSYISVTYDNQYLQIYLNGELDKSYSSNGSLYQYGHTNYIMGCYAWNNTQNYNGNLEELSVWNISLSQAQIQTYMCYPPLGSTPGLTGMWWFNEGMGITVIDSSQYSNTGNAHGTTWSTNVNTMLPVSVSIAATENPICAGTSVTYTATPTNGGSTPSYQWKVNGSNVGTNSSTYSYTPINGDIVTCVLTSNASCTTGNPATSNTITMTVNALMPVSVSIAATENPLCAGTSVTYTATPTNGGTLPAYQWKVNGSNVGTNSPNYTYTPSNNDSITCILTSDTTCATGNPATSAPITMTVNPNLTVSVSISANPSGALCQGTSVTFTAVPANGGTSPAYQWSLNGTPVPGATSGSYITTTLVNADQVRCILTSNATCVSGNPATSDPITMTVNPLLPVSVAISANPTGAICDGTSVIFTATPTNGGTVPAYQWTLNGTPIPGATSSTYTTSTLANGDQIRCIVTSNATCATGNPATSAPITMTVNPNLPVSVTISANPPGATCDGTSVTYTAVPVNGGYSPAYQWSLNGTQIPGEISGTYTSSALTDGNQVQCSVTSNATCAVGNPANSNIIIVQRLPLPTVSLTLCIPVTERDAQSFTLKQGLPLGGSFSGTAVQGNKFNPALVPAGQSTSTVTYSYTNVNNCTNSASQTVAVFPANTGFICGQPLTDVRDNQIYTTQQIGTQCWMSQNLNFGTFILSATYQYDNCLPEKFCYSDFASSCTLYGGLYQWDELMQYETTLGVQGFCPPGWHIPTGSDWNLLFSNLQGQGNAGDSLKTTGTTGFNATLSGVRYFNQSWNFGNQTATFYWSSVQSSAIRTIAHGINIQNNSVSDYASSRANAFSVRCLKD